MTRPTGAAVATVALAVAAGLAGCRTTAATSTPSGPPAASGTPGSGVSTGTGVSRGSRSPAAGRAGTEAAAGTIECGAGQLRTGFTDDKNILDGQFDGMSKVDTVVMFTNAGDAPCRVQGYPGITLLDGSRQVFRAVRSGRTPKPLTLAPGRRASSLVAANSAACADPVSVTGLLVTAPDQRTPTRLPYPAHLCPASATVGALVPGNTGGAHY